MPVYTLSGGKIKLSVLNKVGASPTRVNGWVEVNRFF